MSYRTRGGLRFSHSNVRRIALAAVLLLVIAQGSCEEEDTHIDLQQVYSTITRDLPPGSTEAAILAYLEDMNIFYDPPDIASGYPQLNHLRDQGDVASHTPLVRAYIWGDEGPSGERWDVFFLLDDSRILTRIIHIEYAPEGL